MSRKIKRTPQAALSIKGAFDEFVVAQTAKGFSESTIKNYHSHFHSISKHFDIEKPFGELTQADIDGMIVSMRESGLATNSISSYLRVFKTFKFSGNTAQIAYRESHSKLVCMAASIIPSVRLAGRTNSDCQAGPVS